MRSFKWEFIARRVCLLSCVLLFIYGCSGNHGANPPGSSQSVLDAPQSLAETLQQLDALPAPEGVDPLQWKVLKGAFGRLLTQGKSKFSCQAPGSNRSKVEDLVVAPASGNADFQWTYRSEGDYSQNGVVGLDDLTPLGIHFGKETTAVDWSAAQVADGNRNGKIELGDLTSIGANYTYRVLGYRLQRSADGDAGGTWETAAEVWFAASSIQPGPWRTFTAQLAPAGTGFYRVVPYDADGEGIAGNNVYYNANPAVHFETEDNDNAATADALPPFPFPEPLVDGNLGVGNPDGDDNGDNVDWFSFTTAAIGAVSLDLSYTSAEGDIGLYLYGDPEAAPLDTSATHSGTENVDYSVPAGTYYVKCELASGFSGYSLSGTFQVEPIAHYETENNDQAAEADALPAFPITTGTVTGNMGTGNPQGDDDGDFTDWYSVNLTSTGDLTLDLSHDIATGDFDLYLYRDPAGDPLIASETSASPEHIQYTISHPDIYYIKCARYSGYSEYVLDCAFVPGFVNNPPEAQLAADPLTGEAPLTVEFDAGASTDSDPGDSIVKYEFDFGDGIWFDSGTDPTVTHVFNSPGAITAAVRVTDSHGAMAEDTAALNILSQGSGVWNVLIWMAADNNLATEAYGDIQRLEAVGSTSTVRVLIGYDAASEWITGSGCEQVRFIRVVQDSDPNSINYTADPANVSFAKAGYDSSHPQHVLEFLQWAQQFPAEHSLLVLWDHGDGWRQGWKEGASARSGAMHAPSGLLKDDADSTADMTNNKWIVDTLAAYHFDILLLDACNMGHLEAVYDFYTLADHLLVSETGLPAQGLPYDSILSAWNAGYPLAPDAICRLITDESYTMYNGVRPFTLGVVDAPAITPLIAACTDLAGAVEAKAAQESLGIRRAISLASEMRAGDGERDLHHFLTIYRALTADAAIQGLADDALAQWGSAVAYFKGYDNPGTTGLSVFLPGERFFNQPTCEEYGETPFDQATGWLDMMVATGVPGQAGVPGVTADWAPGDRIEISWSDAAAEIDLGLQGPATNWASPVYPVELNGISEFSADNPTGGATTEWAKLLPAAPSGSYTARLDWFSYGAGTPPALLDVAVKLYDSGGVLKQDLGTYQVALGGEVSCVTLSY